MAMVIVTLVATFAASMVWQQWRAVQVEASERTRTQSAWVLNGALDWARMILREDRDRSVDHLGEVWATPLEEARLSSFLAADSNNNSAADDVDTVEAFLSGKVEDAQAKFNLFNLLGPDGEISKGDLEIFQRLCESVSLSPALAKGVAEAMRMARLAAGVTDPATLEKIGGEQGRAQAPLMPQSMDQLTWLGLDAGTVERLRPYVTLLPSLDGHTDVNVNTASKEVIAAVANIDLGRASRLVQVRQRRPFQDPSEISAAVGGLQAAGNTQTTTTSAPPATQLAVNSSYFEVTGRLRIDDNIIEEHHLLYRDNSTVTVRYQSRFSGIDRPPNAPGTP